MSNVAVKVKDFIIKSKKKKDPKEVKKENDDFKKVCKFIAFPLFLLVGLSLAVVKQHEISWTVKVDDALSYYQTDSNKNRILTEGIENITKSRSETVSIITGWESQGLINMMGENNDNTTGAAELSRLSMIASLNHRIYLYNESVFNQKESFLYFNEINYDYFIMRLFNDWYLNQSNSSNIIVNKQKAAKYEEEVLAKTPQKYRDYIDGYLAQEKILLQEIPTYSGHKFILGELFSNLYFDKEISVNKIEGIDFMNSRIYVSEMQNYINKLINTNKELEGYNVNIKEVRGEISHNMIPSSSEIDNLKNKLFK